MFLQIFLRLNLEYLIRFGVRAANAMLWLERTAVRIFAHSHTTGDTVVRHNGIERIFTRNAGLWQVVIYTRRK